MSTIHRTRRRGALEEPGAPDWIGGARDAPPGYAISGLGPGQRAADYVTKDMFARYISMQADEPGGVSPIDAARKLPGIFGSQDVVIALACHYGDLVRHHKIGSYVRVWVGFTREESLAVVNELPLVLNDSLYQTD